MKNRFLELDCLRGVAALLVVFFHVFGDTLSIFRVGITGVDLFFIISGFVIFLSISNVSKGREFVINRVSRLYPTYWTCVTITFTLMCIGDITHKHSIHIKTYLANMTMFQYYLGKPDLDGPYWTMIIEMIFYIFILILFKTKLLKRVIEIGVGVNVLLIANFFMSLKGIPFLNTHYLPMLNFFPLFIAGIVFYKIYYDQKSFLNNYLILIICFLTQIALYNLTRSAGHVSHITYIIMLVIYFTLFILFVNQKLKLIIYKPILFLGKISFPIYLIHQYLLLSMIIPFLIKYCEMNYYVSASIGIVLVILIASLIHRYIEVPVGHKLKSFQKKIFYLQ
ncbi:hypothetical protein BEL04_14495 [Mucilaginibacter sp. PPCGB 2223]|uniref:acyltransferase family protein n=1 Tax=Mucilaginibacter sp. PPCGB 2223 TaxID=1886027 RepID=UPI000826247E|nr:hypothetical protein BEL04_14495 [Mucilaginibacter sp. PPCGB 2223]